MAWKLKEQGYHDHFERIWAQYPKRAGSNPKTKAYTAFRRRQSEGITLEAMGVGVERYKRFCEATGKVNTELVMQAARFFGPGREFDNPWDVPRETSVPHTDQEWLALGEQRGILPKAGEPWHQFKERVKGGAR